MLKFIVVLAFVAAASAQAQYTHGGHLESSSSHGSSEEAHAEIKSLHSDIHEHGFQYAFETSNHIRTAAEGDIHGNIHGDFEYVAPKGEHIALKYIADENGYQPSSDVLPTPPPIPIAILKSLEYIRSHPSHEDDHLRKH